MFQSNPVYAEGDEPGWQGSQEWHPEQHSQGQGQAKGTAGVKSLTHHLSLYSGLKPLDEPRRSHPPSLHFG